MRESHIHTTQHARRVSTRRRTILGVMGAAALIPEQWTAPIVQAVVLPAHAQTSPTSSEKEPEEPTLFSFENCSVSLTFELQGFLPDSTQVIPTIIGTVAGEGDLSGIVVNIESILTLNGSPASVPQTLNSPTTTDVNGDYLLVLDGFAPPDGVDGPHIIFNVSNCDMSFANGVQVTVSSDDPRLPGQSVCTASYDCADLQSVQP